VIPKKATVIGGSFVEAWQNKENSKVKNKKKRDLNVM